MDFDSFFDELVNIIKYKKQKQKMEELKNNNNRMFPLGLTKFIIISVVFIFVFDVSLFSLPTLANEAIEIARAEEQTDFVKSVKASKSLIIPENYLPQNDNLSVRSVTYRVVTAYNSEEAQCDSTPCITANGFNVCDHGVEDTIAANFLKFGTKVRIPDYFGEKIFIVRDRMNQRFPNRVDIWMLDKTDARKFGKKYVKIEILD